MMAVPRQGLEETLHVSAQTLVAPAWLDRIHAEALAVLEETGVHCRDEEVRHIFEDTGLAAFDETSGHIHVLPPLVEQALTTAPRRDDFFIPENSFGIGGTAPFVFDEMTDDLVTPTLSHLAEIARIAERSDVVHFMARGVLIPGQEVTVMDTITAHCRKPIYVAAVTDAGLDRAEALYRQRGRMTIQFSIINSPLNVIPDMIPPFLKCLRKGLPVYVSSMPMAGLSAPYSMSGLLTLTHAEALFGITLAQLVNPGIMTVHAGLPSIANIEKNYAIDLGHPAHHRANLLMEKVNRQLGLPSIQSTGTTNAEKPGPQAEADAAYAFALLKTYGFHQMRHAFGFLKDLVSFSIGKLLHHIELCAAPQPGRFLDPVVEPFDEQGLAAIQRNASSPNYMLHDPTLNR
ncbi:MAG: trimethylamine methyltransferase family protein, partial [Desulfosarcina sp.]|nr:trimethylamine methyltransferase family protein [Desulfobacterales bacterium]